MTAITFEARGKSGTAAQPGLAERVGVLSIEGAFDVLARASALEAKGKQIVHLEVGSPSFPTPEHVVEAGIRSMRAREAGYGSPYGLAELRHAVGESLQARGIARTGDEVIVTPGTKPAVFYAALATVNPGDEVLVPDPGFPIYPSVVRFAGGTPVSYGFVADKDFAVDVDEIEARITPRTRVLMLNSPNNPTGTTIDMRAMERIADIVLKHDLLVVSDEIYGRLLFDDRVVAPSIAEIPGLAERTIIADGFSKTWSLHGWRLGFLAVPKAFVERFFVLAINGHSCVPVFVQRAGVAALTGSQDHVTTVRKELRRRRDLVVNGLRNAGLPCASPAGAFYAMPDVSVTGLSDAECVTELLNNHGLATLAGSSFGNGGSGFIRLSFASPEEHLVAGLERISAFTAARRGHSSKELV